MRFRFPFLPTFLYVALFLLLPGGGLCPFAPIAAQAAPAPEAKKTTGSAAGLIQGARVEIKRAPLYRSAYYKGGYPPDREGVCTDLIWRAFRHAGYDLKKLIDADIRKAPAAYPRARKPDPNIDFRRVPNQTVFFKRHAQSLSTAIKPGNAENMRLWQPGDIVVFAGPDHIAILSDKRNDEGVPLLLHNQGPWATEDDDFTAWAKGGIVAHFRFFR